MLDFESLLDATQDAPLERRAPLPVGDYQAVVGEITVAEYTNKKTGMIGYRFVVPLSLSVPPGSIPGFDAPELKLTDSVMLDMTENNTIDIAPGKNSRLRMYREATGMNQAGQTFSPRKLVGQPVLVKIKHEEYEGNLQERIAGIAKLA